MAFAYTIELAASRCANLFLLNVARLIARQHKEISSRDTSEERDVVASLKAIIRGRAHNVNDDLVTVARQSLGLRLLHCPRTLPPRWCRSQHNRIIGQCSHHHVRDYRRLTHLLDILELFHKIVRVIFVGQELRRNASVHQLQKAFRAQQIIVVHVGHAAVFRKYIAGINAPWIGRTGRALRPHDIRSHPFLRLDEAPLVRGGLQTCHVETCDEARRERICFYQSVPGAQETAVAELGYVVVPCAAGSDASSCAELGCVAGSPEDVVDVGCPLEEVLVAG
jgi:hypothetical protein